MLFQQRGKAMKTFQFDIEEDAVLSRIGYENNTRPLPRIVSLVDDYINNSRDMVAESYTICLKNIESVDTDKIVIEGNVVFKSRVLAKLLAKCEEIAVFGLTIGSYLEDMVSHLTKNGLMLQATVLDAVGSGAAEQLAVWISEEVSRDAGDRGLVASRRFSPGYCDWDVSQQREIFNLLDDTAGISLSDSYQMTPRKSITGIIGIGYAANGIHEYNPCGACQRRDCPGRRK
jgi:hypothetical protein